MIGPDLANAWPDDIFSAQDAPMLISPMPAAANGCAMKISQATSTPASIGAPTVVSRDSATVTLSAEARAIQALLQTSLMKSTPAAPPVLMIFWARFGEQNTHRAGSANAGGTARKCRSAWLALAHQAVNFVLSKVGATPFTPNNPAKTHLPNWGAKACRALPLMIPAHSPAPSAAPPIKKFRPVKKTSPRRSRRSRSR